jgi:MerR family transcriptional regulator, heat shock protein HspR
MARQQPRTVSGFESATEQQLPTNAAFVISVAARLVGVHEQTLRYYERAGLVEPARSNLAGVEVIMRLTDHIRVLEERIEDLERDVRRLSARG